MKTCRAIWAHLGIVVQNLVMFRLDTVDEDQWIYIPTSRTKSKFSENEGKLIS